MEAMEVITAVVIIHRTTEDRTTGHIMEEATIDRTTSLTTEEVMVDIGRSVSLRQR